MAGVPAGSVRTRPGTATAPDLILSGEPQPILGLLWGKLTVAEATAFGLETTGDVSVLQRIAAGEERATSAAG